MVVRFVPEEFETDGGKRATLLMQEHAADIILALKAHSSLCLQWMDVERSAYLLQLSEDIYDLLGDGDSPVVALSKKTHEL